MNWTNVFLIFQREVRDQSRDRRTLFTVIVLPVLLYPLLGAAFLQMGQFLREHPTKILVLGAEHLPAEPQLIVEGKFASDVCSENQSRLLELELKPARRDESHHATQNEEAVRTDVERLLQQGKYDAAIYFPSSFSERMSRSHDEASRKRDEANKVAEEDVPQPVIYSNTAIDKSRIASMRLQNVLDRWRATMVRVNLAERKLPPATAQPFVVRDLDVAEPVRKRAAVWSKVLPFVILVWALTGAFYPAIDLCAGEKERGTLETLLCSPAMRSEIVWGKLFTVMTFSMATALLNLVSMGITVLLVARQFESFSGGTGLGPPPLGSLLWLVLALPPMSALFSALAIAISAFARSTKEGQYYLMPLLMITFPLMMLPMLPAAQLDLGTSLIPVSGLMLLLRSLMEGQVSESIRYAIPVAIVTGACCLMAIRWAIDQFNRESVLFRESEQWGLGLWLRHLVRDREDTPNLPEAFLCAVLILVINFFAQFQTGLTLHWESFRTVAAIRLIAFIATPALLMAVMLTRKPWKTLLLKTPSFWLTVPAAVTLAACLHPAMNWLHELVLTIYPISPQALEQLAPLSAMIKDAPLWQVLLVIAVAPAICEELAFRGFILSGFRHIGNKWTAIALSAAFFGVTHGLLQQSIMAFLAGMVIGYVAVKTGSLLPAIAYHFTHNALSMLSQRLTDDILPGRPWLRLIYDPADGMLHYSPFFAVSAALFGVAILLWYKSLPYEASHEERLQRALENQGAVVGGR